MESTTQLPGTGNVKGELWREVNSLEDLTVAIELYTTLIDFGRYDDAEWLYYQRLSDVTLYNL